MLYRLFIEPHSRGEDNRRREFILNIILCGIILLLGALDLFILYKSISLSGHFRGIPFPLFTDIFLFFCFLLLLSRRGYFVIASYITIATYFIGSTYGMYHWGFDLHISLLSYILIIIISSILIDTKFGFVMTTLLAGTTIIISHLQFAEIFQPEDYWKFETNAGQPIQFALMYFLTMTVCWLSNREIEKSLIRARSSERALQKKNESLEQIVEERTMELRQAQAEKVSQLYRFAEFGRLSSGVFHDLMNPLSVVALNMNYLKDSLQTDPAVIKKHIDSAITASRRMERFMTIVRKQIKVNDYEELFNVNEEIEEAIALLQYKATKENVPLHFEAFEEIGTFGNSAKFQQVLSNLISNAIDAYDGVLRPKLNRVVEIVLKRDNLNIQIHISDYGCGIPQTSLSKIFDPFFTTKSNHKGIGIGLSNTKEIIERNFEGTIAVTSIENQGSTFIITFPCRQFKDEKNLKDNQENPSISQNSAKH